uniref:Uncharacterized protein n=1 Tax=Romanomermis culicivorax TaxID=13658 RepID=A0A915JWV4_ROMCU
KFLTEVVLEKWRRLQGETCNGQSAARPAIYYTDFIIVYCGVYLPRCNVPRRDSHYQTCSEGNATVLILAIFFRSKV